MKKYPEKLVAFAVTERARGCTWKRVQFSIKEEFGITPPSARQMRKWFEWHSGATFGLENVFREALIKAVRESIPAAALATLHIAQEKGIPVLLEALRRHRDPSVAGVVMVLAQLEETAGSPAFDAGLQRYLSQRQQKVAGWVNESTNERGK